MKSRREDTIPGRAGAWLPEPVTLQAQLHGGGCLAESLLSNSLKSPSLRWFALCIIYLFIDYTHNRS